MIKIKSPRGRSRIYGDCSYFFFSTSVNKSFTVSASVECTIFCKSGQFKLDSHVIMPGDSIHCRSLPQILYGTGELYVAQMHTVLSEGFPPFCEITRDGAHKKVTKPWGYELWINGEHPRYCVKRIFITAGHQTSLQYHNLKEETNLIESGQAMVVYQSDESVDIDSVEDKHLDRFILTGPQGVHIVPRTIHRIQAITDIYLFEVSTPHLDDVIRLADDSNRGDGRIESEHK